MGRSRNIVTLRPESNRREDAEISQAPEMTLLQGIYEDMTELEKARTIRHLKTKCETGFLVSWVKW